MFGEKFLFKVFFILPHLGVPPFEQQRYDRVFRERRVVFLSREMGVDARLFLFSREVSPLYLEDDISTVLAPVNDRCKLDKFSHDSDWLLSEINREAPDLIVVKGVGYEFSKSLLFKSKINFRLAFVAAGGCEDPVLPYADFVFFETFDQFRHRFSRFFSSGSSALLPKLNLPSFHNNSCNKKFDVVNVGTFNPNKNQAALLPLADRYRLALVGDGECWDGVRSQAATAVCPVFMPGNLPREQVGGVIAQSRLMVHSAKYEGLPRVVMEAFAAGVPVVASRRAMPGAFEHGVQGLLVEPEDLLEAARSLLEDPPRLAAMGLAASAYAERCCSEQAVFTEVARMYAKVMERPPRYTGSWWQKAHILARSARMGGLSRARELAVALGFKRVLIWLGMRK